ncbi:MAG: hypothetical protein A2Y21_05340 [Clostridiales bacterium GWC2_40_7]|nr:MAG: hypothetical protein A2Y21_05340 [Clostridiales bacterium GWC2_40_7]
MAAFLLNSFSSKFTTSATKVAQDKKIPLAQSGTCVAGSFFVPEFNLKGKVRENDRLSFKEANGTSLYGRNTSRVQSDTVGQIIQSSITKAFSKSVQKNSELKYLKTQAPA